MVCLPLPTFFLPFCISYIIYVQFELMQDKQSYPIAARKSLKKILLDCQSISQIPSRYQSLKKQSFFKGRKNNLHSILKNKSLSLSPKKRHEVIPTKTKRKKLYQAVKKHHHHYGPSNASQSNSVLEGFSQRTRYRTLGQEDDGILIYHKMLEERKKLDDSRRLIVLSKVIKQNLKKKNHELQLKNKHRMREL